MRKGNQRAFVSISTDVHTKAKWLKWAKRHHRSLSRQVALVVERAIQEEQ